MIGETVSHYRIVAKLGGGGMGVVYEAEDLSLGRRVALKFLPDDTLQSGEALERFKREARAASALEHPHICTIHEIADHEGRPFIVMERLRGCTLKQLVAAGPLPPEQVMEIGAQIADALDAAHGAGVVHRDLKPANVFVTERGEAKLLDFGLAKTVSAPHEGSSEVETALQPEYLTSPGTMLGTVAYMSPEQAQGKAVGPSSDVFSLGIVLYEMTTARRPFDGDNSAAIISAILRDTPPPVAAATPSAPAALDRVIRRCLEKDAAKRYPTAAAVRDDLRNLLLATTSGRLPVDPRARRSRRLRLALVALTAVAVVVAAAAAWWLPRQARERWLRGEALPRLEALVDHIQGLEEGRESWDAFTLARRIEAVAPDEPLLNRLWPRFTRPITITSDPSGAAVEAWYYDEPEAAPVLIGRTPLEHVRYPRGFTRVRVSLPGREPVDDVIWNFVIGGESWHYTLHAPGEVPADMTWIPGGTFSLYIPGLDHLKAEPTTPFLMDRHEVTNAEYKRFVDAGGYADARFWRQPFVQNGKPLGWKEAMARFVDRTGRPGPAGWEVGAYPEGQGDYPVGGISWYEAAAYAEWAGKSLPTIFHWNRVAFTVASSRIVPLSNLGGNAARGPVSVNSTKSMNRFGVHDLAGNVREWTWNANAGADERYILGGGWNDPDYAFVDGYAQPAFDRSPTNGFRCVRTLEKEPNLAALQRTIERPFRDFLHEKPVSDAVFAQYLRQFVYDKTPLDARVEEEKPTPNGIRQKITFSAAYAGERMMAYLFLPTVGRPPYQTVVLFPGSGVIDTRSSASLDLGRVDFLLKSGRAVIYPIYKGTFERGGDLHSDYPSPTAVYKDYVIMWAKDLGRSIDYVETRGDLDASRVAYYGVSWGGGLGAILPAVEKRIKANVLYVAGLSFQHALPEVDQINYVTRVRQPTLILNGEFDFYFPTQTSQRPMFELLGTPPADKKRLVFPGGHSVPRTEMIKESLAWLDRYLGPVRF